MTRMALIASLLISVAVAAASAGPARAQMQQSAPPATTAPDRPAETGSLPERERLAPSQQGQQVAPTQPDQQGPGCSYRDNKLELLV